MNNQVLPKNQLYNESINKTPILLILCRVLNIWSHLSMLIISTDDGMNVIVRAIWFAFLGSSHLFALCFPGPLKLRSFMWFPVILFTSSFISWKMPGLQDISSLGFILRSFITSMQDISELSKQLKDWRPFYRRNIRLIVAKNMTLIDAQGSQCSLCAVGYYVLTSRECCGIRVCMACNAQKHNINENSSKCHNCAQPCDVRSEVYTVLNLIEEIEKQE